MVCEVVPVYADVVHVATNVTVKNWNEMSLCRPKILPAPVRCTGNVSTYVNKTRMVDCLRVTSFDASITVHPNPIDAFKSYEEIEESTLFLLPMLKKNAEVFGSFLFMIFVFNIRMIFNFFVHS